MSEDRFRFRFWHKGRMTEGGAILSGGSLGKGMESAILMQCTGLKDKNGRLIYEGDIIKWGTSNCHYCVYWEAPEFGLYDYPHWHGGDGWSPWPEHKDRSAITLEVIGNIHENPELLKGE